MGKLSEIIKNIKEFLKKLPSKQKKILIVIVIFLVSALTFFFVYSSVMKYGLLYSELDASDSKYIHQQLVDMGIEVKIRGRAIYVPRNRVDELRLTFSPDIKGGSKGFELLDQSSGFGYTDEEFLIQKQRIVQGELERTIKSFSQVRDSRVHISPSKTTVFMTEKDPSKASVYLKLHPGESLSKEQVKSIIHLVSSAWNNLPFENVEVVDGRMNLLSLGIYDGSDAGFNGSLDAHMNVERSFEYELERGLLSIIEPILGAEKVRIRVNADLDFDSKQKTELIIDENNVPISEHIIKDRNGIDLGEGGGPLDNNMSNVEIEGGEIKGSARDESIVNYEVSKSEIKTIHAPGEVKRITVSLVYDGNITQDVQGKLERLINGVVGFNAERGDTVSIVGMEFNGIKDTGIMSNKNRIIPIFLLILFGAIIGILILFIFKRRKKKVVEESLQNTIKEMTNISQEIVHEGIKNNAIEETNPENKMLEEEIRSYASNKPDQVVEIIKSWMMEDLR